MVKDNFEIEAYLQQASRWPSEGKVILAQYDAESITVYQAYNNSIGHYAAEHGVFGGEFSFSRMTWVKPNFLWMMYRSGWGVKDNQEVTLAVKIKRSAFDKILTLAVPSAFDERLYDTKEEWKYFVQKSNVRLQWDPDHDPFGEKLTRRAIQLGLRGDIVRQYSSDWILDITDISEFVKEQRNYVRDGKLDMLSTPKETVYLPNDISLRERLGIDEQQIV